MSYVVVFDAARSGLKDTEVVVIGVVNIILGAILLATIRYAPTYWKRGYRVAVGLGFLVSGLVVGSVPYRDYWLARHHGRAQVVAGVVSYFVPMPVNGHAMETFCVKGKCFCYSDYVLTPGFNNTSSHGGPMKLGISVRVIYVGNTIMKLEIAR